MSLRVYKGTSPGQRFKTGLGFTEITKTKPERTLISSLNKTAGRSNGTITVRGKGGGHKRNFREIDFKRNKREIEGTVASVEYDPNRTANIALIHYKDGEKKYILAPLDLKIGDKISAAAKTPIQAGNAMPLINMPIGTFVHNIELMPGRGGQIVRSAGAAAIVAAKEGKYVHLKLPSKEVRKVNASCFATIGQIGNIDWKNTSLGKAGKSRHMGRRPKVRGVAMDPNSHPHGGGEGKSGVGMHPKTRQGKPAAGKTRSKKKPSGKFILSRRNK